MIVSAKENIVDIIVRFNVRVFWIRSDYTCGCYMNDEGIITIGMKSGKDLIIGPGTFDIYAELCEELQVNKFVKVVVKGEERIPEEKSPLD